MGLVSTALADTLEHGTAVIIQSRLVRRRCEATGMKSRQLVGDLVLNYPRIAPRLMRGGSEVSDVPQSRPREVWVHRPTANRWIVVTDTSGNPISAVGPFAAAEWDAMLRDYVPLDGHHSLAWLREHIEDFSRDGSTE